MVIKEFDEELNFNFLKVVLRDFFIIGVFWVVYKIFWGNCNKFGSNGFELIFLVCCFFGVFLKLLIFVCWFGGGGKGLVKERVLVILIFLLFNIGVFVIDILVIEILLVEDIFFLKVKFLKNNWKMN